jgi:hypothetical protein
MQGKKESQLNETRVDLKGESTKLDGKYYLLEQKSDTLECFFCCFCEGSNEYTVS